MTTYAYRCRTCGAERESSSRDDAQPCACGGVSRRQFCVSLSIPSFKPHYNHAVGEYVSTSRQFDDLLKSKADDNSRVTGITHSYVRIDPGDSARPSKDDSIFEAQQRTIRDKNINPATLLD